MEIVLASCKPWPEISRSDAQLMDALTQRGHRVFTRPWNDAPLSDFTMADMVVLRSNWDFHHHLASFETWLDAVTESSATLKNPADLVRAFMHKDYLHELNGRGIKTPQTLTMVEFDVERARSWMRELGIDRVVHKPAWGASGHGVALLNVDDLDDARALWAVDPHRRTVQLQEFIAGIAGGEHALVFFDGEFSHALHRTSSTGDFRVNSQYGGNVSAADGLNPKAIEFGKLVLDQLPSCPTYVRIDIVVDGSNFTLMEVEVNEPALGLDLVPGSGARFADALLRPGE